jgi:hypothetical protein
VTIKILIVLYVHKPLIARNENVQCDVDISHVCIFICDQIMSFSRLVIFTLFSEYACTINHVLALPTDLDVRQYDTFVYISTYIHRKLAFTIQIYNTT